MSFQYPVSFDQDILLQYREELQWANQEVELLAIKLERHPEDLATVEQIRHIIEDSWLSSVKLELTPISESLADTLKGLDLLLDWQVYPPAMTEFILILIDRLMDIAREVEEHQYIDMRKTQAILVALQFIILAKSPTDVTRGIEDAIVAISQAIDAQTPAANNSDDVMLFDDGVDLFDDGVDLFTDSVPAPVAEDEKHLEIFVPQAVLNPLCQAREFMATKTTEDCALLLGNISDQASQHHSSHTRFLLELALAMNFIAGKPLDFDSLYKGICLHDIALASLPDIISKKGGLSKDEIDEIKLHPLKSAQLAHELCQSDDTELLVLHHHERMDGSGYPYGLKGDNISEQGKLVAIVDSFHSNIERHINMTERERVLRAIIDINLNVGTHFDPSWVKLFNNTLRDYWLPEWRSVQREKLKQAG